ncbi:MAG: YfhO family protein [SAR324 cluster bacterium]|nr:YfhO family protein [SAR324 cluster bacterium]
MVNWLSSHFQQHWARYLIGLFVLFQFGDVLFGEGTLSTFQNSPAGFVYHIPKHNAVFEGGSLNRFKRQHTSNRAFWDRPMVYDPNIKASGDLLFSGEFPWFNPYLGLGVPLFANGVGSTFFIGSLLMGIVNSVYWDWVYLGLFFISGLMTYQIFHRFYFFEKTASLIGTLIFLSSGLFAPQMSNGGESFNIYCFIFAIYFVEIFRASRSEKGQLASAFAVVLCLTQSSYAGMSEGTVANYFMICGYLLIRSRWYSWQQVWRSGLWIFFIFVTALLLSAPYLSALYYNSTLMSGGHLVGHITIPVYYLADIFLPYLRGWIENEFFPPEFPNHLNVIFLGILPLNVFLLRITQSLEFRNMRSWLIFFLLVVFYLSQSFGSKFFTLNFVEYIPIVNKIFFFRFFAGFFAFVVCLLTTKVLHDLRNGKWETIRYRFFALLWIGVVLYFLYMNHMAEFAAEWKNDPAVSSQFLDWNKTNTASVVCFALLFSLWIPWFRRYRWWSAILKQWNILLLSSVFIFSSYQFSKSFFHKYDAFQETPVISFLKQKLEDGEWFRIYSQNLYFPSTAAGYGVPDIRYMIPITPQNTTDVLQAVFGEYGEGRIVGDRFESILELDGLETYNHPGFDILNVRYFIFGASLGKFPSGPRFREAFRSKNAVIIENLNVKERFFFVSEWEMIPERRPLLQTIRDNPQILFKKALLYMKPIWPNLNLPTASSTLPPRLLRHTNHSYRLEIQLRQPQILVISDTYYEGRKASINGQEISVQSVNGGMTGIPLPAGKYQLEIRFEHSFFTFSLSLFILGCLIVLIAFFVGWKTYFHDFFKTIFRLNSI